MGWIPLLLLGFLVPSLSQELPPPPPLIPPPAYPPVYPAIPTVIPPAPGIDPDIAGNDTTIPPVRSRQESCNSVVQKVALALLYLVTEGENWVSNSFWLKNIACPYRATNGTVVNLPDYCCWDGVTCCVEPVCPDETLNWRCNCKTPGMVTRLVLSKNNMVGPLPGNLLSWLSCELKFLDLTFNQLTGSIASNISLVEGLEVLALSYNSLTGTIPGELGLIQNLTIVDLTSNQLNGTIPANLCSRELRGGNPSQITDLLLAGNKLYGAVNLTGCRSMIQLDLTDNDLSGPLPSFQGFPNLHTLRLRNNSFEADAKALLEGESLWLSDLDISSNMLSGTVPERIDNRRLLSVIRLNNNSLTGTLPQRIFSGLGNLQRLSLSHNQLTGTIPNTATTVSTVNFVDLSSNWLVGTLPDSIRSFARVGISVNLQQNMLSCCGINPLEGSDLTAEFSLWRAYQDVDWSKVNDPSTWLPPWIAFSRFHQPMDNVKGREFNNMRCPALRVPGDRDDPSTFLDWKLDPDYYMYKGCICESGFHMVNRTQPGRLPSFRCEPESTPWYVRSPWILVLVVVGAVLLTATAMLLLCTRRGARFPWLQHARNLRKRLKGEPKDGLLSVVTTDIEGYSDLMKRESELMGKGLRIHNWCIEKARWQFYGATMDQEGDSFTIAFHDPFDAVAFCLQAQLLLQRVEWPDKLANPEGFLERARKGSMFQGMLRILGRDPTLSRERSNPEMQAPHLASPASDAGGVASTPVAESPASKEMRFLRFGGLGKKPPIAIPEEHAVSMTGASVSQLGSGSTADGVGVRLASAESARAVMFNGLRVRMGIATMKIEKGMTLRNSPLIDMAKLVSDAAAGGQVLMDGKTFREVKGRLVELGAVDHSGLNMSRLSLNTPGLISRVCCRRKATEQAETVVVLDMGKYVQRPHTTKDDQAGHNLGTFASFQSHTTTSAGNNAQTMEAAALAAVAAADDTLSVSNSAAPKLHLYQVLSPGLRERARHFGSTITLKEEWICVDPPYFSAPGAENASLGLDGSSTIPAITMVFCMVDGCKELKRTDRERKQAVQRQISGALMHTVMAVKGGYVCRVQEDEFKYMVAFPSPEDAIKWCLLMQDALMWQKWPDWVLRHDKMREEKDDRGEVVFRGPRLRMGICHGCPRAIVPDHLGRADYHGASINSAARYMDAAAHGGQVVCEEALAVAVLTRWSRVLRPVESGRSTASSRLGMGLGTSRMMYATSADGTNTGDSQEDAGGEGEERDSASREQLETHSVDHVGIMIKPAGSSVSLELQQGIDLPTPTVVPVAVHVSANTPPGPSATDFTRTAPAPTSASAASAGPASGTADTEPSFAPPRSLARSPSGASGLTSVQELEGGVPVANGVLAGAGKGSAADEESSLQWHYNPVMGTSCRPSELGTASDYGGAGSERTSGATASQRLESLDRSSDETGGPVQGVVQGCADTASDPLQRVGDGSEAVQGMARVSPVLQGVVGAVGGMDRAGSAEPRKGILRSKDMAVRVSPTDGSAATSSRATPAGATERSWARESPAMPVSGTFQPVGSEQEGGGERPSGDSQPLTPVRRKTTVRITLPDGAEEERSTAGRGNVLRPSNASGSGGMFTLSTYKTAVYAYRLGAFKFKGSPEEIPMSQLLLEAHNGRRFPSEPPAGKGNRVSAASGLVMVAPFDLPSVSRRYFWDWKRGHDAKAPPTPRISTFNKLAATFMPRSNSMTAASLATQRDRQRRNSLGDGRVFLPSNSGKAHSRKLLQLVRGVHHRNTPSLSGTSGDTGPSSPAAGRSPFRRHTTSNNGAASSTVRQFSAGDVPTPPASADVLRSQMEVSQLQHPFHPYQPGDPLPALTSAPQAGEQLVQSDSPMKPDLDALRNASAISAPSGSSWTPDRI